MNDTPLPAAVALNDQASPGEAGMEVYTPAGPVRYRTLHAFDPSTQQTLCGKPAAQLELLRQLWSPAHPLACPKCTASAKAVQ
jgi:hypothetical protein